MNADHINLVGGDFNCVLNPTRDRESAAPFRPDPSANMIKQKLSSFVDTYSSLLSNPLFTFSMNTQAGPLLSRLDYIFIDSTFSHLQTDVSTFFANSDHLALKTDLFLPPSSTSKNVWKLNSSLLNDQTLKQSLLEHITNFLDSSVNWDSFKTSVKTFFISHHNKKRNPWAKINRINKKIISLKALLIKFPNALELSSLISKLEIQRDNLSQSLSNYWRVRSRSKWIEKGEKSTKYFFQRFQINSSDSFTTHLARASEFSQTEAMAEARSFYQNLYNPETVDINATASILNNLPKISEEANNKLLQPITTEEIKNFLFKLPNNKSPGTDGISYEF